MDNNKVFKTQLYLYGIKDNKLIKNIFSLAGWSDVSSSKIKSWRTDIDNPRAGRMPEKALDAFFNGLFEYRELMKKTGLEVFNFPHNNTREQNSKTS